MIVLAVAALGVVATLVMWRQDRSHRGGAVAPPLQWGVLVAALVAAVAAAVAAWPTTWSDSGAHAILLLGVPVVLGAASLCLPEQGRWRWFGVWLVALLLLGWALLLGLGVGLIFVPAALLLLLAAALTVSNRHLNPAHQGQASVRPAR